jgi:hypothetical protein
MTQVLPPDFMTVAIMEIASPSVVFIRVVCF